MARKLFGIGDVNPIEYGGGYAFDVLDASQGPWLEYYHGIETEEAGWGQAWEFDDENPEHLAHKVVIYRVDLESTGAELLARLNWADLGAVADSCGGLGSGLNTQNTVSDRARLIEDVAGHYGWHELDSYPLEITIGALIKRWE